jgi:hypothetical protein
VTKYKGMRRIILTVGILGLFINTSCKKCTKCSYTYTSTEIIQTVNGEEVVETTETGYVVNDEGELFTQECVKSDEIETIEDAYQLESESTTLEDFEYVCGDV